MSDFARYEAYKDSGVEWLGEIPSEWSLIKSKYLWREKEQRSINGDEQLLSVSQYYGVLPNISDSRSESLIDYKNVSPDDLVINIMLAWMGGLGISVHEGVVSPAYCVYKQTENNSSQYLGYLYRTQIYLSEFAKHSKGVVPSRWRMYTDDFGQILTLLPPILEQNKIVIFLNQKTTEIDEAITKKQRLIELLKEQKAILINQAVTKGLNPNVPMRDSDVEWIGDIPAHWDVKKIKHTSKIFRGKFTHRPRNDPKLYDGNYPFFQTGDIARAEKTLVNFRQTLNEKGLKVSTLVPKGTVVITIAANIGDIAILGIDACFPDSVVGFLPQKNVNRDFLYNALSAMKSQFISSTIKNTQMNLNVERIGSNFMCLPPEAEQEEINLFLDKVNDEIKLLTDLTEREIEKLNEFKQTLIAHAVTGKIKV